MRSSRLSQEDPASLVGVAGKMMGDVNPQGCSGLCSAVVLELHKLLSLWIWACSDGPPSSLTGTSLCAGTLLTDRMEHDWTMFCWVCFSRDPSLDLKTSTQHRKTDGRCRRNRKRGWEGGVTDRSKFNGDLWTEHALSGHTSMQ